MFNKLKRQFDDLPTALKVVIIIGVLFILSNISMCLLMVLPLLVLLFAILIPLAFPIFLGYIAYRLLKGNHKTQLR